MKNGISIVIPTFRRAGKLINLMTSIQNLDVTNIDFEVLVVSNLEDIETEEVVMHFSNQFNIRYLVSNAVGVNLARNMGLKLARYDVCAFLDDDCELTNKSWLQNIAFHFESDKLLTGIGGYYLLSERVNLLGITYHIKMKTWLQYFKSSQGHAHRLVGGCLILKKSMLAGMAFDPLIKFGGAETSLVLQLNEAGKNLKLFEELSVKHNSNLGLFEFFKKIYLQGKFHQKMALSRPTELTFFENNFFEIENENIRSLNLSQSKLFAVKILLKVHRWIFYGVPRYLQPWI